MSKRLTKTDQGYNKGQVVRSPVAQEWSEVVHNASDDKDLLRRGSLWLRTNKSNEAAGEAIIQLIEKKASKSLVRVARNWLTLFSTHQSVPSLIGTLLKVAPSAEVVRLAAESIKLSENPSKLQPVITAIVESPLHPGLYKKVEQLLEHHPQEDFWGGVFVKSWKCRNRKAEKLITRWLDLNADNPKIHFVEAHALFASSPEVIEAIFRWLSRGGRASNETPRAIDGLIGAAAKHHRETLPRILRFARDWLKKHPSHEDAGHVYAEILYVTRSRYDILRAIDWHREHRSNFSAWFVLANLLELSYLHQTAPNRYALDQAKLLLRQEDFRRSKTRLVGAAVGAVVDDETVAWAAEAYERTHLDWMLERLILLSGDQKSIALAEQAQDRWKDSGWELTILYGLLIADPQNRLALRRARLWLKRNPKHSYRKKMASLIHWAKGAAEGGRRPNN